MVLVRDILAWLDRFAPFRYAAPWDQCGLQVGNPEAPVDRLLVALDPTSRTLEEARKLACQCLVTHHPLLFQPLKALRSDLFPGNLVIAAVLGGIHVIAAHTNVDAARDGTNDILGGMLSVVRMEPLERDEAWIGEDRYGGMGRIGQLAQSRGVRKTSGEDEGSPRRYSGESGGRCGQADRARGPLQRQWRQLDGSGHQGGSGCLHHR